MDIPKITSKRAASIFTWPNPLNLLETESLILKTLRHALAVSDDWALLRKSENPVASGSALCDF